MEREYLAEYSDGQQLCFRKCSDEAATVYARNRAKSLEINDFDDVRLSRLSRLEVIFS